MIRRSNLAEQLRECHLRSKNDWASVSIFSSSSSFGSSRWQAHVNFLLWFPHVGTRLKSISLGGNLMVDVVVFVIWELVILAFLVFSAVSLYFRHMQLALILICITMLLLLCMKITKQIRLARKKKQRMLDSDYDYNASS
ncbi:hypothetical protein BT93_F2924 [Corymbia citriodora subsp. variegata]|nr:hypothetical protein BT93_F2924 [Corymbia citriodora subsp. variegata]